MSDRVAYKICLYYTFMCRELWALIYLHVRASQTDLRLNWIPFTWKMLAWLNVLLAMPWLLVKSMLCKLSSLIFTLWCHLKQWYLEVCRVPSHTYWQSASNRIRIGHYTCTKLWGLISCTSMCLLNSVAYYICLVLAADWYILFVMEMDLLGLVFSIIRYHACVHLLVER